ncbi:MAG: hypothetical protein EWM72_02769 [Nitrospira sp.]|nr:MAG: hypothetical protein EWM72_02769 [Nitrospira sp.]
MHEQHTLTIDSQGRVVQITRRTGPSAESTPAADEVLISREVYGLITQYPQGSHQWSLDQQEGRLIHTEMEEIIQPDGQTITRPGRAQTFPLRRGEGKNGII